MAVWEDNDSVFSLLPWPGAAGSRELPKRPGDIECCFMCIVFL